MVATGFRSASAWTRIPKPRPGLKPSQGSIRITSRRCCHALRCWWTRRCVRIGHACWSGRDRRRELPNGLLYVLYVMDVIRTTSGIINIAILTETPNRIRYAANFGQSRYGVFRCQSNF